MKTLVFAFLLLLGVGAQPALACVEEAASGDHARTAIGPLLSRPIIDFERVANEQHCDCPARIENAQAAVTEPEKLHFVARVEGSAVAADPSFAEWRRALDARSRFHADAAPASSLPQYLLTARLRC